MRRSTTGAQEVYRLTAAAEYGQQNSERSTARVQPGARLDGVREGHGYMAQAHVGEQVAQRVHGRKRQHRDNLQRVKSSQSACWYHQSGWTLSKRQMCLSPGVTAGRSAISVWTPCTACM